MGPKHKKKKIKPSKLRVAPQTLENTVVSSNVSVFLSGVPRFLFFVPHFPFFPSEFLGPISAEAVFFGHNFRSLRSSGTGVGLPTLASIQIGTVANRVL